MSNHDLPNSNLAWRREKSKEFLMWSALSMNASGPMVMVYWTHSYDMNRSPSV
jgi:hypothetical protein